MNTWFPSTLFRPKRLKIIFVFIVKHVPILLRHCFVVADCMSIPSREEWERMLEKAEKKAKELLAKYEKKCTERQVDNVTFFSKTS